MAQHQRDARITTIYEGTTGIQANDLIGRKVARDGGAVMRRLIAQMSADASAVGHEGDALMVSLHAALRRGVEALAEGTEGLLARGSREAAADAVPYLWLAGTAARRRTLQERRRGGQRAAFQWQRGSRIPGGQARHGAALRTACDAACRGLARRRAPRRRVDAGPCGLATLRRRHP